MKKILSSSILLTAVLGTMIVSASNVMADDNNNDKKTTTNLKIDNKDQHTNSLLKDNGNNNVTRTSQSTGDFTLDFVPKSFNFPDSTSSNKINKDNLYVNKLENTDKSNSHYVQVSDYESKNDKNWTLLAKISDATMQNNGSVDLKIKDLILGSPFYRQQIGSDKPIDSDNQTRKNARIISKDNTPVTSSKEIQKYDGNSTSTLLKGFQKISLESERKQGSFSGNITWTLNHGLTNPDD